jgi:CheY-like chemotaxis protein/transcriptional regulator with XRE-family HTH domain
MAAEDAYLDDLRDALNHLYDPDRLRASRLLPLFDLGAGAQAATRLQQVLLDGVHRLRPWPGEPARSARRRIHGILQLRYEQQFTQKEVAAQLGLGVRQYRRLQHAAIRTLGSELWERFNVGARLAAVPPIAPVESIAGEDSLPEALRWIAELPAGETTQVAPGLQDVIQLIQSLAALHGKTVRLSSNYSSPDDPTAEQARKLAVAMPPLVFRQTLLHLLNAVILNCPEEEIVVEVTADPWRIVVRVQAVSSPRQADSPAVPSLPDLALVRQMMEHFDGTVTTAQRVGAPIATLTYRSATQRNVLAIDDHTDALQLLQRYAEGTRFRVIICREPQQALALVLEHRPQAILLDVMMPEIDGWEVLTRLKQDPATAPIPVIVCTVLDQSELAVSLGATAFLRKPITRPQLLAVLDAVVGKSGPAAL